MTTLQTQALIERLQADRDFHLNESERIIRESLDVDAEGAYSIQADTEESFHTGRVEALQNVIDILSGREVALYSETFREVMSE